MKNLQRLTMIIGTLLACSVFAYGQELSTQFKVGIGATFDQTYQLNDFLLENNLPYIKNSYFPVAFLAMNTEYRNINLSLTFGVMDNLSNIHKKSDIHNLNVVGTFAECGLKYSIYHSGLSTIKIGCVLATRKITVKVYPDQSRVDMSHFELSNSGNEGLILNYEPKMLGVSGTFLYDNFGITASYMTSVNSPGWSILNYSETNNKIIEKGNSLELRLFMTIGKKASDKTPSK